MKVRILDNSIRFRVSIGELASLVKGELVTTQSSFISGSLSFHVAPTIDERKIDIENGIITLALEKEILANLQAGSEAGISFQNGGMDVKFEKDFKCLTDRGEDERALFENPRSSH